MELKNKKIIVTGGAGGIGSELVRLLFAKGSTVAVMDNDTELLDKLKGSFSEHLGSSIEIYRTDISKFKEVKENVERFYNKYGEIDALINNAAILRDGLLLNIFEGQIKKLPRKIWKETIDTNLSGYFYCTREVVEKMVMKRTKGIVVNISSISSSGNAGQTSYSASKAAINALTVTWSQELSKFGIRVAGVSPGMTDTSMPRASMPESTLEKWVKMTPVKRMAFPSEIASTVMFVLENDFICGRTLEVDGGLRM